MDWLSSSLVEIDTRVAFVNEIDFNSNQVDGLNNDAALSEIDTEVTSCSNLEIDWTDFWFRAFLHLPIIWSDDDT
jgi:hypothetical protein